MRLRRSLVERYGEGAVIVPSPSHQPLLAEGGTSFYCLNSSEWCDEESTSHGAMLVLKVAHGSRSIMLPGDSDHFAWKDRIMPEFGNELQSEILARRIGGHSRFMGRNPSIQESIHVRAHEIPVPPLRLATP